MIFDQERYNAWRRGYQRKYRNDEARLDEFDNFESNVLKRFNDYRVPSIELLKDTPKEAVCQVFEKVNTGGVTLYSLRAGYCNLCDGLAQPSQRLGGEAEATRQTKGSQGV